MRATGAPEVELSSGAASLYRTDLDLPAPGMDVAAGRAYASGGIAWGGFGWGWSVAGVDRLRPCPDGTVELHTAGGARYVFAAGDGLPGSGDGVLTALRHPGELGHRRSGGWFLSLPDGSYTEYDEAGYPTVHRDRLRTDPDHGSEIRYLWHANGGLAEIRQANGARTQETLPRSVRFSHDPVTGVVTAAEDATGRRYEYTYDSHGRPSVHRCQEKQS